MRPKRDGGGARWVVLVQAAAVELEIPPTPHRRGMLPRVERSTPEIDDGDASSRPTYASGEPRDPGYGKTSLATVAARGIASHAED